jgi:hypothetical protein
LASLSLSPRLDATHRLLSRGGVRLLVRRDWEAALPVAAMLDGAPLAAWGTAVLHALAGRGVVHVLATPRGEIVAKQFSRGGMVGGLLRERYFDARRPLREAEAAELLLQRGVRTPVVVAARVTRLRGGLRLEVATAREPGVDLLSACRGGASLPTLGLALGRTLRTAHAAGLRHRDLQVKNLLVPAGFPGAGGSQDPESLVILDLDRCSVGGPLAEAERQSSLVRLGRSLVKQGLLPGALRDAVAPTRAVWACRAFVRAYGVPAGAGAAFLARLTAETRAQLRTHAWLWGSDGGKRPSTDNNVR